MPRGAEIVRATELWRSELGQIRQSFASAGRTKACPSEVEGRLCLYIPGLFFFFDFDAKGFQELQILIADFEFGVGR